MSEELVVINNNQALQLGGVGLGSAFFKARPLQLELVHKTSRAENVKYGEFRVVATNEHLGTKIRAVLLAVPQPRREWFIDPTKFTRENKGCFSLDGVQPHPRAIQPQAMFCKVCPKGDINWDKWRKTKNPADLPPCGAYWHLLIAERQTQTPYMLDVKGRSALPFKQAMEQQMAGLMQKLISNVKAENKLRGYTLVSLQKDGGPIYQDFRPTPGFTVPEGGLQPPKPMPNIFDVSFDIYSHSKDGGAYQMGFSNFALMKPEDAAEFGQLYLDIVANKAAVDTANEEAEAAEAVTEQAAEPAKPVQGEVLPPINI